ncbi:hypothetical protein BC832DRAFT_541406 [Gaertneriomyces semiglobifer]|nr:hypothetical protein BC832DRAFT_541406 [Gaertneriomyces semiglobifer]
MMGRDRWLLQDDIKVKHRVKNRRLVEPKPALLEAYCSLARQERSLGLHHIIRQENALTDAIDFIDFGLYDFFCENHEMNLFKTSAEKAETLAERALREQQAGNTSSAAKHITQAEAKLAAAERDLAERQQDVKRARDDLARARGQSSTSGASSAMGAGAGTGLGAGGGSAMQSGGASSGMGAGSGSSSTMDPSMGGTGYGDTQSDTFRGAGGPGYGTQGGNYPGSMDPNYPSGQDLGATSQDYESQDFGRRGAGDFQQQSYGDPRAQRYVEEYTEFETAYTGQENAPGVSSLDPGVQRYRELQERAKRL